MLRRILRQCANFGVSQLHLINSARWRRASDKASCCGQPGWMKPYRANSSTHATRCNRRCLWRISSPASALVGLLDRRHGNPKLPCRSYRHTSTCDDRPRGEPYAFLDAMDSIHTGAAVHLGGQILNVHTALTSALAQALPRLSQGKLDANSQVGIQSTSSSHRAVSHAKIDQYKVHIQSHIQREPAFNRAQDLLPDRRFPYWC